MKKVSISVLILVFISIFTLGGFSQSVSKEDAQNLGKAFINHNLAAFNYEKTKSVVEDYFTFKSIDNQPIIHVFNYQDGGFILVSADKRAAPILGYSFESQLDINNIAPATEAWINSYALQIEEIIKNNYESCERIDEMWYDIEHNKFKYFSAKGVDKLMNTRWNQNYPYNYHCPQHPAGPGGRVLAGCVATAMAQIMKFYDYPERGRSSHQYFWGQWLEVDFESTEYRWDEMTPVINSLSRDAIAELIFHCGVSVNMNYDYNGSGSSIMNSFYAMRHFFRYRSGMEHVEMHTFELPEWQFVLRHDLDRGKPILYRGVSDQGDGHAYVVDGYQNEVFFHFNWGWGGYADGFFYLDEVNPQTLFPWNQGAVVNISPQYAEYCDNNIMTQPAWTFDDGSGPNLYFTDTNCQWLISIDTDTCDFITLNFNRFNVIEGDMVKVYDGNSTSAELLGSFTGSIIPPSITSSSNELLITFETNSDQQGVGWEVTYESIILDIQEDYISNVSIYPNPADDIIYVNTNFNKVSTISLFDIYGKKLLETVDSGKVNIDVSSFASGIYLLRIENDSFNNTSKIIIQ